MSHPLSHFLLFLVELRLESALDPASVFSFEEFAAVLQPAEVCFVDAGAGFLVRGHQLLHA